MRDIVRGWLASSAQAWREVARLEWWLGDGGDPATLIPDFLDKYRLASHGLGESGLSPAYSREPDEYRAVLFVSAGLVFERRLRILADGAMLGGVFTLVYSLGRSFASENDRLSFVLAGMALFVTTGLGYLRFARQKVQTVKASGRKA